MVGHGLDAPEENSGHLSFRHHLPHTHLYQRSTHLYFDTTIPTLTVAFINRLQRGVY